MTNVTSWTETEVSILVEVWSEIEAKYPMLICSKEAGALHTKVFALFSKRCAHGRSSNAVRQMKNVLRNFVLFVHKGDEARKKAGERLWFELSVAERRALAPLKLRTLAAVMSVKTFGRLMKMDRAQRWLGGDGIVIKDGGKQVESSFLSPMTESAAPTEHFKNEFSFLSASSTPSTEQGGDKGEERKPRSVSGLLKSEEERGEEKPDIPAKLKHRDCNILLESMMKLQAEKMNRSVAKLQADIEGEIQRGTEMLLSIISSQLQDAQSSGDVAFVTKVLNMQKQQIHEHFQQFDEERGREEAAS